MNRLRDALRHRGWLLASFALPVAIYVLSLVPRGVHPFGPDSVMYSDLGQQYVYFYSYLKDAALGPESLLFTWRSDLGMGTLPLVTYYMTSPFLLVVFLFGDGHLPEALIVMTALKLGTAGAAMAFLLRRVAPGPAAAVVAFSTAYALMTWGLAYAFNLMWLDGLYLLPLVLIGVERLLTEQRVAPLAIALSAAVVVNFYIAWMIVLFTPLYLLARYPATHERFELRGFAMTVVRAGIAGIAAVLTSLALLLPTLVALRDRPLPDTPPPPEIPVSWAAIFARLYGGTTEVAPFLTPNLAAGTVVLLLAPAFFLLSRVRLLERIAFGIVVALLVFSLRNPFLYSVWHGFDRPNAFRFRFSFLLSFLLVYLAYRVWVSGAGRRTMVTVAVAGAGWFAVMRLTRDDAPRLLTPAVMGWAGGCLLLGAVLVLAALAMRRWWAGAPPTLASGLVAVVVVVDVTGSAILVNRDVPERPRATWTTEPTAAWASAMSAARPAPDEFYRAEGTDYRTVNDSLRHGNFGLTHFSSTTYGPLHRTFDNLGFTKHVYRVWISWRGSTLVTDAALGFRYVVAPGEVDRFDTRLVRSWPGTRLYENTLALPAGFFVEPSARKPLPKDPFAAQEQLIGAPGLFTPLCVPKPEATNAELTLKGGTLVARRGIDGGSMTLRWTCRAKGRQQAYAWTRVPMPWSMETVTWDGKQAEYPSIPDNGILGLGSFEDRTFDVTLTSRRKQLRLPVAFVRGLDVSRLERRVSELRANAMTDVTWSGRGLSGRVAKANGGLLFLAVPKVPGWRVQVDGKTVRPRRLAGSFLGLDLGPGEHRITLSYWPPAFNAGIGGTAAGLVLLGLLVFLDRRRTRVDAGVAVPEQLPEPRERDLAGAM